MIKIQKPESCSGCTACASACPRQCISMEPDALGFKYPRVNEAECTSCGLCDKICPFNNEYKTPGNFEKPLSFAGKSRIAAEVAKSQSGAAFAVLSDWILETGGVVYGVGYEGHFVATHKRAVNKEQRDEFRGSKYVQSDLGGVFLQVKKDLEDGLCVMFTGTPCQTAGLQAFLPARLKERLFVMDIVCHGVPGPKIWQDYLRYLEAQEGSKIGRVNFRDKSLKGWRSHVESFRFEGKANTYTYTYLFYSHINLRHSCGDCKFTNLRRTGDITVADCWGIEQTEAARLGEDNKGCSLFLVNTAKGKRWFEAATDKLDFMPVNVNDVLQPQLQHPSRLSPYRRQFEDDYVKHGFEYVMGKYSKPFLIDRLKHGIYLFVPKGLWKVMKRMIKGK